ncbi:3-hydroxyisobutyrate dehydrogenase [Amphibacillus marinus]|uniref:3-hydroxyisobutyrate dehydrogenase n=1 Tax=Amphibacillus marinus TaxID=872970 RepID=A0A1H8M6Q3_9BACI|nr:NAD(P)-dependent oxidoreductase [Amphibacillus marinus]SEO12991.1 3-hydroxyisobutyrate dehydrogenase [Amphibacillus marinus]
MIGFIGLGIMGNHMAENLLDHGYELVVHNRTKSKATNLLAKGAIWADSPQALAKQVDVVITMLTNEEVVNQLAFGPLGFLTHAEVPLWVDCSTVGPKASIAFAQRAEEQGARFLDAPVSGSKIPAQKGELIFLVGGDQGDLAQVRPMLEVMGKDIQYHGEHGKGSAMKLVINLMLAQAMATFTEAVAFGQAIGLEEQTLVDTLLSSPTTAPILATKRDKLIEKDFAEQFPLEHMHKDLYLVSKAAFDQGASLPIAGVTKELYSLAKQYGYGREDLSAIYQLFIKNK